MKKLTVILTGILLGFICCSCGVNINDQQIIGGTYEEKFEVCDIKLDFHKQWDSTYGEYVWTSVELQNMLDQRRHLYLLQVDNDVLLNTELAPLQSKTDDIRIEEGTDVYIQVYQAGDDKPCGINTYLEL
jgi:hypothetical protein